MRVVFLGSPDFAVPSLYRLSQTHQVSGVVTQPDRHAGRGRKIRPPAVKIAAQALGLPISQPSNINSVQSVAQLKRYSPDIMVVAAYGQILRPQVLNLPRYGCINVHPSLLPRWRGAAPVQAAIRSGDRVTGVTIIKMDAGLDSGPIIAQESVGILPQETGGDLASRLSLIGASLLIEIIPSYVDGSLQPTPQDNERATYAPLLKKSDGLLRWEMPARDLERRILAFEPWPASFFEWNRRRVVVRKAHAIQDTQAKVGEVVLYDGLPAIGTSDGLIVLDILQPAGKKPMGGDAFLRGAPRFLASTLNPPPNGQPLSSNPG